MVRLVHVILPRDKKIKENKKSVSDIACSEKYFNHLSLTSLEENIIIIRITDDLYGTLMKELEDIKIGVEFGIIDTYTIESTKPPFSTSGIVTKKVPMPIEALREQLWATSSLNLDYFLYLSFASIIASVGLATNNAVMIVASMIISPLMGPLLSIIFSLFMKDWKLLLVSLLTEFLGFINCLIIGMIFGLAFTPFVEIDCKSDSDAVFCWPNFQMKDRGNWISVIIGVIVSTASGFCASLAFTGGVIGTLVGVAISASLLPPICNSGIMLIFASLGNWIIIGEGFTQTHMIEAFKISGISALIFLINIILIVVTGFFVLLFKKISPFKKKSKKYKHKDGDSKEKARIDFLFNRSPTFPDFGSNNNLRDRRYSKYGKRDSFIKKNNEIELKSISYPDIRIEENRKSRENKKENETSIFDDDQREKKEEKKEEKENKKDDDFVIEL